MAEPRHRRAVGPLERALTTALRTADVAPRDRGTVALAKRYAALIDAAAPAAKYTEPLRSVADAVREAGDAETAKAFRKIADALAEHSVASDLGPKLLDALHKLGMTPAARAAGSKPPEGGAGRDPAGVALGQLQLIAGGAARAH